MEDLPSKWDIVEDCRKPKKELELLLLNVYLDKNLAISKVLPTSVS